MLIKKLKNVVTTKIVSHEKIQVYHFLIWVAPFRNYSTIRRNKYVRAYFLLHEACNMGGSSVFALFIYFLPNKK